MDVGWVYVKECEKNEKVKDGQGGEKCEIWARGRLYTTVCEDGMGWENNKAQGDMVQARELFLLNGIWSGVEWSGEWSGVVVWEEEEGANGIFLSFFLSVSGTPIAPKSCKNELWMKFIVIQKSKLKNPIPNILHQHRSTA